MKQVTRTRITQDWQARFPMLGRWKAGRLLRRVGPLVQGVCLDRSSNPEDYLPIAHIHFLGMEFPTVPLDLPLYHSTPNGSTRRIEYRFHDQEYVGAADQLRRDYPVPFDSQPTPAQILGAYRDLHGKTWLPRHLEEMVLLSAMLDMPEEVDECLALAQQVWDAGGASWRRMHDVPPGWLDEIIPSRAGVDKSRAVVEQEVQRHKLSGLPVVKMPHD